MKILHSVSSLTHSLCHQVSSRLKLIFISSERGMFKASMQQLGLTSLDFVLKKYLYLKYLRLMLLGGACWS